MSGPFGWIGSISASRFQRLLCIVLSLLGASENSARLWDRGLQSLQAHVPT